MLPFHVIVEVVNKSVNLLITSIQFSNRHNLLTQLYNHICHTTYLYVYEVVMQKMCGPLVPLFQ